MLGLAAVFLIILAAATTVARLFNYWERQRLAEEERATLVAPAPLEVTVEERTLERTRRFAARLRPWAEARLAAEVSGRVMETLVEAGEVVDEGAPLLRVDPVLAQIAVDAAEAGLAAARVSVEDLRRQVEESRALLEARSVARSTHDALVARLEIQERERDRLEVELRRQRELLERHVIRAPFAGVVNARMVDPGDSVSPGQVVVDFVAVDPLRVIFHAGEREVETFTPGSRFPLRFSSGEAGGETEIEVRHRAASSDPVTGLFRIEGVLPNPEGRIPGGLTGVVEAVVAVYRDHLTVPAEAVRFEGLNAYVEEDDGEGGVRRVRVELGPEIEGRHPVLSGLERGQVLLIR